MFAPETLGLSIVAGSIIGGLGGFFGSGGPHDHGNLGTGGSSVMSFFSPVPKSAVITSPFGPRNSKNKNISKNHRGIDFGIPVGSPLTAVTNGVISTMGSDANGYGNWVEVKHEDGTASRYGHLSQIGVSRGQKVVAGQVVGKSGGKAGAPGAGNSTGPHLHFEILNSSGVKVNPAPYLSGAPAAPSNSSLTASAVAGPRAISGQTMSAAKQTTASLRKGPLSSQSLTVISSPSLSSSLTTSGFNEDLGGPIQAMNIGSTHSSSSSKNVVINLQMKVHIAQ
jgi:hypothetical protein